jgi:hypothetical protein
VAHRDVLGLEVRGGIGPRSEHAHAGVERGADIGVERDLRGHGGGGTSREVDDGDRAVGVDDIVGAGLALVRDEELPAVGGEGDHVRERADLDQAEEGAVGGEEHDGARVLLGVGLDRHGDEPVVDGHAVGDGAPRRHVDAVDVFGGRGIGQVEDVERGGGGVRDEQARAIGVECSDFGTAFIEGVIRPSTNRHELDTGEPGGRLSVSRMIRIVQIAVTSMTQ